MVRGSTSFRHEEDEQARIETVGFMIAVIMSVLFAICLAGTSLESGENCEIELEGRINPNKASAGSLVRLPGIGPALASEVVYYRERFSGENFKRVEDLQKVKGIGPKKVEQMKEWLKFE